LKSCEKIYVSTPATLSALTIINVLSLLLPSNGLLPPGPLPNENDCLNDHSKPESLGLDEELEVDEEGLCVGLAFLLDASPIFLLTFSPVLASPIYTILLHQF